MAAASAVTSPGGTSTPHPSRISGIMDTRVEMIGRARAMASKSFAGTWPRVSLLSRCGTTTRSAAERKSGTWAMGIRPTRRIPGCRAPRAWPVAEAGSVPTRARTTSGRPSRSTASARSSTPL